MKRAPSFFPSFSPPSRTRMTLSWIGNVALVPSSPHCLFMSLFFYVLISLVFCSFPIHFLIFTYSHFVVLEGSIIACRSIQCHIVALELDIDVFKSILPPPIREHEQEHTYQYTAPLDSSVFAPLPQKMAKRNFDLLCA